MSGGRFCRCAARKWRVTDRNCNHSAFNGSRYQWSRYSQIVCLHCGWIWRSKGQYVNALPDLADDPKEKARWQQHGAEQDWSQNTREYFSREDVKP